MNFEIIFYFIFSSIALTSAIFVIYSKNAVYSVFFLILVFSSITGLLLISEIEFLSIMLIIIYIGAITVLFLFVVMMLDINVINNDVDNNFGYIPIIFLITSIFFFETFLMFSKVLSSYNFIIEKIYLKLNYSAYTSIFPKLPFSYEYKDLVYKQWLNKLDNITNIETLGQVLYTYYAIFLLIAGIILLIALIGAVTLTLKERKKKKFLTKNIFEQLSRNSSNAIFKIKNKIQP
jgi:NADH-quinone oxidoreductase subunit J